MYPPNQGYPPQQNFNHPHHFQQGYNPNLGPVSNCDFLATLLLCIFLGGFGVHYFYVNRPGLGILCLLTCGGFGIWALIDIIIIATGGFRDGYGLPVKMQ